MTTPMPAEPADAGSTTPKTEPPLWVTDYDLSDQPNQAATEPPEVPPEADPEVAPQATFASARAASAEAPTDKRRAAEKEEATRRAQAAAPKKSAHPRGRED